jgi:4-amino-4-deoxy-L-arabinose transferase-like glycosyltransferase
MLLLATLNFIFQVLWFWRFSGDNITMDAVNYIGLARHLIDRDFSQSVHNYWSPLLTWLIAAGSFFTGDLTVLARVITIASLMLCMPLIYLVAFRLWHSHVASAFAVLWLSIARGIIAGTVITIQADYLFTACALAYFTLLLACLREGRRVHWFLLGTAHGFAFLAKAFAMPWLAISTVLAVIARPAGLKSRAASLLLAFVMPVIVWLSWGEALKTRYGFFTTGSQLRANLMVDLKRRLSHHERGDPYEFVDTPYDKYMVSDSRIEALREFRVMNPLLIRVIAANEARNVPLALKELIILLTPGGLVALIAGVALLTRKDWRSTPETIFAWIAIISLAVLIGVYGMLVFDTRYLAPIIPVLMAIAARFLVLQNGRDSLSLSKPLQQACLALFVASILFFTFYWASPFRTVDRNFEASCHNAAATVKNHFTRDAKLISVGEGPYPVHGVGFEVGVYVAYLSGSQLVAMNSALPPTGNLQSLTGAVLAKGSDAVLVWGSPSNPSYREMIDGLQASGRVSTAPPIMDPTAGEVGRVMFLSQ